MYILDITKINDEYFNFPIKTAPPQVQSHLD